MYIFLGSIALIFIGSFLPWANLGILTVNGTEGDGVITLILAIVGLVIYFAAKNKPKVVKISTIAIGVLTLIITLMSFSGLGELSIVDPGGGLIMVCIGSIGLTISAFLNDRFQGTKQYEPETIATSNASSEIASTNAPSSFCSNCGKNHTNGSFCSSCGHNQTG